MSVNLLLRSGERRLLKDADGAYVDGRFFIVTKRTHAERVTVLTLSAADVVQADVISEEGGTTVIGGGASPLARDWNERAQRPVSEL